MPSNSLGYRIHFCLVTNLLSLTVWYRKRQSFKFSSVQCLDRLCRHGDMTDDSADSLPVFSAEGCCAQFWHRQECLLFDVVHPAFPLPTTVSPTLQGVLKDGCGETVVPCDMPELCKLPFLCVSSIVHRCLEKMRGFVPDFAKLSSVLQVRLQ